MASVSFLVLFLLSLSPQHLLLYSAADDEGESPPALSCRLMGCEKQRWIPFALDESKLGCEFSGEVYCDHEARWISLDWRKWYRLKNSSPAGTIVIQDEHLQKELEQGRCDFYLPGPDRSPAPVSIKPAANRTELITLYKCRRNLSIVHPPASYTYDNCSDFIIYYDLKNRTSPLPPDGCSIIQDYPINKSIDLDNLVPLLTSDITLEVHVSTQCLRCPVNGSHNCQDKVDHWEFQCADDDHRAEDIGSQPQPQPQPQPQSQPQPQPRRTYKSKDNGAKKVGLGIGLGFSLVIVAIFIICLVVNRQRQRGKYTSTFRSGNTSSDPYSTTGLEATEAYFGIPVFQYNELEEATHCFHPDKEIGDGGFGTVYHGQLRDGREVAVKRLYQGNYKRVAQFVNEIQILTRLRHPNLVSLYGCTSRHSRELLLVYEFIPNGTVDDHLHGARADSGSLTWPIRLSIAIETASALCYLHASDVVHRDVKTNNILLDNGFCVKVADFGISRLFPFDATHVSTAPQGTPGYVDPEYHQCYQLTEKSDVYSFGVVLVELISSLPAVDITRHRNEINLSKYAMNKIQEGAFQELVDPRLGFGSDLSVSRMTVSVAELAFRCLQPDKETRPSMDEVLEILKEIESDKQLGLESIVGWSPSPAAAPPTCSDEVGLSKSVPMMASPDTVTPKWTTTSSAPS